MASRAALSSALTVADAIARRLAHDDLPDESERRENEVMKRNQKPIAETSMRAPAQSGLGKSTAMLGTCYDRITVDVGGMTHSLRFICFAFQYRQTTEPGTGCEGYHHTQLRSMRRLMPPNNTCSMSAPFSHSKNNWEAHFDDKVARDPPLVRRRIDDVPLHLSGPLQLVVQRLQRPCRLGVVSDLEELDAELGEREPTLVEPFGERGQSVGKRVGVVGLAVRQHDQVQRLERRRAVGFGLLKSVQAAIKLN